MKKFNKLIQFLWIAVAAFTGGEAIYMVAKSKELDTRFYVLCAVFFVAIIMYYIRKRQGNSMQ
ncbi:MAG: hypothetical protein ACI8SE_000095 [Bacteroidia bacterium]|jgi:hypothetical protein